MDLIKPYSRDELVRISTLRMSACHRQHSYVRDGRGLREQFRVLDSPRQYHAKID